MSEPFIYDKVAYPSIVFEHIRPDQIGAVAALHGVPQPNIANCRVLELGCGDGANLLSIAYTMPNSTCVGFDLSGERIAEATASAQRLGLSNARFHHMNVMDYSPEEFGEFDLIIAHGLYSWVPDFVRERVLKIYETSLKPNGIGFISYNAYPGWHFRGLIRDAMLLQAELIDEEAKKVEGSMNFLRFLMESARPESVYKSFLEDEYKATTNRHLNGLFHDELSEINQPFYFRDFVGKISGYDLKFLSESEPVAFFTGLLPKFAQDAVNNLWDDPHRREQYLDFLRCTRFRGSLVCRNPVETSYRPLPDAVGSLFLSSRTEPVSDAPNLQDGSNVEFSAPHDSSFTTNHPFTKMLLGEIRSRWPERTTFNELAEHVWKSFPDLHESGFQAECERSKVHMIELITSSVVEVRCFSPAFVTAVSASPHISAFARWQAESGFEYVTSMTGANHEIENDLVRTLIVLLDGSRGRDQIETEMLQAIQVPDDERGAFEKSLPELIDMNLNRFARSALLIG
jgi:SAM-dependent methyltransferase